MFRRFDRFSARSGRAGRAVVVVLVWVVMTSATALPAAGKIRRPTERWDPGIEDIAEVVEDIRGLEFERPVPVEFARSERGGSEVSDEDQEYYEDEARLLRSLGVVPADADILKWQAAGRSGALAYYDQRRRRIVVYRRGLTPFSRVVLAHELTHALDDQHYRFVGQPRFAHVPAYGAYQAVVEGDAERVESEYYRRLPRSEQGEVRRDLDALYAAAEANAEWDTFEWYTTRLWVPYFVGSTYTEAALARGGPRALKVLFEHEPFNDVALLDPFARDPIWQYLGPRLVPGMTQVGSIVHPGAVDVYLLLASRLPADVAYNAARRVVGSSMVSYQSGPNTCARLSLLTSGDGLAEVMAAADRWVAASAGHATQSVEVLVVTIDSCGGLPALAPGAIATPAALLTVRMRAVVDAFERGATEPALSCVGDELMRDPRLGVDVGSSFGRLSYPDDGAMRAYRRALLRAYDVCGVRSARGSRRR